jgi:murein DD-endopeptidase MepM/ murein hydrolase activator NlpD
LTLVVAVIYGAIAFIDFTPSSTEDIVATESSRIETSLEQPEQIQQLEALDFQSKIVPVAPKPGETVTQEPDEDDLSIQLVEADVLLVEKELLDQPTPEPGRWLEETVASGDSLALIFERLGLTPQELHRLTYSSEHADQLTTIKPGESLRIRLDHEDRLQELVYQPNPIETLHFTTGEEGFESRSETKELKQRRGYRSGTIESSFYLSAQEAGLSDGLIMDLATIFGWDIDFALEIRKGDSFSVVYEEDFVETFREGNKYGNGRIVAAEFSNQGRIYRAIRYEKDDGEYDYYSPDGRSMRKAFLRAPVDFRRISSRFAKERYHPVLGKKRPHRGVDYAAATGTPIKAAGDGKVIFRGKKNGYGNTVIIKHGSEYSTLYGHMSRFRGAVKKGTKVRQGEIIGYVGKTGLATGPHLHYEFRINGKHKNPLTVKLPASKPIEKEYREDFMRVSKEQGEALDQLNEALLVTTTME